MLLNPSGLETHPVGTGNPNAIINANWQALNAAQIASGAYRPFFEALAFNALMSVSLKGAQKRKVQITGDCTFTVADIAGGYEVELLIDVDATDREITWPVFDWRTAEPPSIFAANTKHVVRLISTGGNIDNVAAWYEVKP